MEVLPPAFDDVLPEIEEYSLYARNALISCSEDFPGEPPSYSTLQGLPCLPQSNIVVPYTQVPIRTDDCKHAVSAILASNQSVSTLTNIVGTYLSCKLDHESGRQHVAHHRNHWDRSKPEVKTFDHIMQKLETLSAKIIKHKRCQRENWEEALGPFRRQVFAELYNANEIVRGFGQSIQQTWD